MTEDIKKGFEWLTKIGEGLDSVKKDHLELVGRFQDIRAVHHALTQFEVSRLKTLEGEASPRVVEMEEKLNRNLDVAHRLDVEGEVSRIQVPQTAEKDALIHGRLTDEKARGQGGLIVALTDGEGKKIDVGNVEADASGYFSFVLAPEKVKAMTEQKKEIYLTVINSKGEVCYRRPTPLKPQEGDKISETVILSSRDITSAKAIKADEETVKSAEPKKQPAKKDK